VNEVLKAAQELQTFCESKRWPFCIIGGLALLRWGEPRETVDVDITLLTGFGVEEPFIEALVEKFEPRVSDASNFALRNRVLLLRNKSGVGLDIALAGLPFEESAVRRSTPFSISSDLNLRTCAAEDLIVFKAFAARPKDWLDIEGILIRQRQLDWSYIQTQLEPLIELKGAPEILRELEERRKRLSK
jgi:hypothetical protein